MNRNGRSYAIGRAQGAALVLTAPLSFYGGVAPRTGLIVDQTHPQRGACITGRILVLSGGKGSSSSSSVLAEAIRLGTAPGGIIIERPDAIMVIGCIVAQFLYDVRVPIMACAIEGITDGQVVAMTCEGDGTASFHVGTAEHAI